MNPARLRSVSNKWLLATLLIVWAIPAGAKVQVDFNPEIDFSKYKTFAYPGGVENLVMLQLNPDLINNRVHRAVTRELLAKGLQEVKPEDNPDLVVRYWANSSTQINVSATGNWGPYGAYIGSYWGFMYDTMTSSSQRQGSLLLDVIDPRKKDLVWRLYIIRKITNVDKAWKQADEEFTKGFESYPSSPKEICDEKERALGPQADAREFSIGLYVALLPVFHAWSRERVTRPYYLPQVPPYCLADPLTVSFDNCPTEMRGAVSRCLSLRRRGCPPHHVNSRKASCSGRTRTLGAGDGRGARPCAL